MANQGPGLFLLPPVQMYRCTLPINSPVLIYTPGWGEALWELPGNCLAQEHNTISPARAQTQTGRPGDERTNHEATAPQQLGYLSFLLTPSNYELFNLLYTTCNIMLCTCMYYNKTCCHNLKLFCLFPTTSRKIIAVLYKMYKKLRNGTSRTLQNFWIWS